MSLDTAAGSKRSEEIRQATVRFAGDSGDGMQLTGIQFTNTSAVYGNDISTLPDFPAEIRAPAGTVYGVSGFQLQFGSTDVFTPGDVLDALVAMNPAALKVNVGDLKPGGILIVNEDSFNEQNLKLANYAANPLQDKVLLEKYRVHPIPMTQATMRACAEVGLTGKDASRCKNFFALGVVCWLYSRPLEPIIAYIEGKFGKEPQVRDANVRVLRAGFYLGETQELFSRNFRVLPAKLPAGRYRDIRGNQALAIGLVAASQLSGKPLFYGSYPITPASEILHDLSEFKNFGVKTFQAEDEIAAMCATIGAAFGGAISVTGTSGPGMALKTEAIGLGVMLELPMVIVNVQRGGPSTGLPTKVEQADLFQAVYGRNGECPLPVIAAHSPADCFDAAIEAVRIAVRHMTPVILLTDGFLANSAEPWLVPKIEDLKPIEVEYLDHPNGPNGEVWPYLRDENLVRPWILPGTPGLAHRIGGLEKADKTGNICYDPPNHHKMVEYRQKKVEKIADFIPPAEVFNDPKGTADTLLVGWGGTFGALREATMRLAERGHQIGHLHLRNLHPFPKNLGEILKRYRDRRIYIAELNMGQLRQLLRAEYLIDLKGINKVQGRPFTVQDIIEAIDGKPATEKSKA